MAALTVSEDDEFGKFLQGTYEGAWTARISQLRAEVERLEGFVRANPSPEHVFYHTTRELDREIRSIYNDEGGEEELEKLLELGADRREIRRGWINEGAQSQAAYQQRLGDELSRSWLVFKNIFTGVVEDVDASQEVEECTMTQGVSVEPADVSDHSWEEDVQEDEVKLVTSYIDTIVINATEDRNTTMGYDAPTQAVRSTRCYRNTGSGKKRQRHRESDI